MSRPIYDVIVCGAGPSGINACIQAKRLGLKVLLIEKEAVLGGTNILSLVNPLMTFHNNGKQVIGGIASEIVETLINNKACLGHINDPLGFCSTITPVDLEYLKSLYFNLIAEEQIDLLLHTQVVEVIMKDKVIDAIKVLHVNGFENIKGKMFIDATGDGNIAYLAKADYLLGRDVDHLCQPMTMPFQVGNVDMNKLKEAIKCDPHNFVVASSYDYQYVGISGFFKEIKLAKDNHEFNVNRDRVLLFEDVIPNQVTINMTRVSELSALNVDDLTKAEMLGRKQIEEVFIFLKKYIPGFENSYIVKTPYQIGVRETRHIVCDYMMTKEDILNNQTFEDSIAIGAFPMDIHAPKGDSLELSIKQDDLSYEVPMRILLPKNLDNLIITGRAIGATHEAAASLRTTPIVMALGQAAGVIASVAIKNKMMIHCLDYQEIQKFLLDNKQIIKK